MSPPNENMGRLFSLKKAFHGGKTFLVKFMGGGGGGGFYMGPNDQIMQEGGKVSQMYFPVI